MNATYDEIESCLTLRPLRVHDERLVRTVMLTGIRPTNPKASRGEQTRDVLEQMERGLAEAGLKFSHVIRTWFYLQDILGWYGEFNKARTAFFEERGTVGALCRDIALRHGLILRATYDSMLLSPPLVITRDQVDELFDKAWKALDGTAAALGK